MMAKDAKSAFLFVSKDLNLLLPATLSRDVSYSKFDLLLKEKWDKAMSDGHFKYTMEHFYSKVLPGKLKFVVQMNFKRFSCRRPPQKITHIRQPFPTEGFNFNKISESEVLFYLCPPDVQQGHYYKHAIIINNSPLEDGHVLLVPFRDQNLAQELSPDSVKIALQMIALSSNRGFRLGWNSLCANSSVNHLHFHAFYVNSNLILETLDAKALTNQFYETIGYPIKGFVLQLVERSVTQLACDVCKVTNYLTDHNIPFNMTITRGEQLTLKKVQSDTLYQKDLTVRVYIWPRKPNRGIKDETILNVACFEASGIFPLRDQEMYDSISEEKLCELLQDVNLPAEQYEEIKKDIINLFI